MPPQGQVKSWLAHFVWVSLFCEIWCKNSLTDKSYLQTILTANRINFHYLFEFSDILPIFAKQLFIETHLSISALPLVLNGGALLLHFFYTYHIALHHHFGGVGHFSC
nr:MAG TPA: hypothetical protein [Bacteriophage sp.]